VLDKQRTLAHAHMRGLVDPTHRPDGEQRARLRDLVSSPRQDLVPEEADLLWRFRFHLVDDGRALAKFLLAVDWEDEAEVIQATELLEQWSPVGIADALKLLGKHMAFRTGMVRSYAIDTLAAAPDGELRLYLLQLVQALKFDGSTADELDSSNNRIMAADPAAAPLSASDSSKEEVSLLARFLIDRAASNLKLANDLYWYLKVELKDVVYGEHYYTIFSAFEEKLRATPLPASANDTPIDHPKPPTSDKNKNDDPPPTMWDILEAQDRFVMGIMESQMTSRDNKGRKEQKEARLRQLLASNGFDTVAEAPGGAVPVPSAPEVMVVGVQPQTAFMFKSALYPAVIEFRVAEGQTPLGDGGEDADENTADPGRVPSSQQRQNRNLRKMLSEKSPPTNLPTYKVMFKTGDDLRQDQLVIQLVRLMDGLLKRVNLDLCLKPYSIIATSPDSGLVEFVSGSAPISQILANNNNSIMAYFQKAAPQSSAKYSIQPDVLQTYVRSLAGYCVITFILGIGDRHLDNIMLQPSGHFFHIDFGFIFGRDPKGIQTPFRLTREMVDGMGGGDGLEYGQFVSFACQAYNVLRKSAGLVLNLLRLTSDAGIEDLSNNPNADADGIIAKVEEKFRLDLSDEQAENYFHGLIDDSLGAFAPRVMEVFHQIAVARR